MRRGFFLFVIALVTSTVLSLRVNAINILDIMKENIKYQEVESSTFSKKFEYTGSGLDNVLRGYVYYVISKSPDFTGEHSYIVRFNRFNPNNGTAIVVANYSWDRCYKFLGVTKDEVKIGTTSVSAINGTYYQCMVLYYYDSSTKDWEMIAFRQQNDERVIIGEPDPEPQYFDLKINTLSLTPTTTSTNGSVVAKVQVENTGNQNITDCYIRFFLSKSNTLEKPYLCLFSPEMQIGTINGGQTITSSSPTLWMNQAFASAGSYFIIADIYTRSSQKDSDNSNNQKVTTIKLTSSTRSLTVTNDPSYINIRNISEDDLGSNVYISGNKTTRIKESVINQVGEMNIQNDWSDPILFITIVSKDGVKQTFKLINN